MHIGYCPGNNVGLPTCTKMVGFVRVPRPCGASYLHASRSSRLVPSTRPGRGIVADRASFDAESQPTYFGNLGDRERLHRIFVSQGTITGGTGSVHCCLDQAEECPLNDCGNQYFSDTTVEIFRVRCGRVVVVDALPNLFEHHAAAIPPSTLVARESGL